jgi:hypothetical protein
VQVNWLPKQVEQGETQVVQTFETAIVPELQFDTQEVPCKLRLLLHVLHWEAVTEQVEQLLLHGTATPDILTYPVGT